MININSNEPLFFPYNVKIRKFTGSCNNINDSYAKLCARDVVRNINVKVFDLISRTGERGYIIWNL